jgi:hypothetical protein
MEFLLTDYAIRLWRQQHGRSNGVPKHAATAAELPIEAHLAMQAALQPLSTTRSRKRSTYQPGRSSQTSRQFID